MNIDCDADMTKALVLNELARFKAEHGRPSDKAVALHIAGWMLEVSSANYDQKGRLAAGQGLREIALDFCFTERPAADSVEAR